MIFRFTHKELQCALRPQIILLLLLLIKCQLQEINTVGLLVEEDGASSIISDRFHKAQKWGETLRNTMFSML